MCVCVRVWGCMGAWGLIQFTRTSAMYQTHGFNKDRPNQIAHHRPAHILDPITTIADKTMSTKMPRRFSTMNDGQPAPTARRARLISSLPAAVNGRGADCEGADRDPRPRPGPGGQQRLHDRGVAVTRGLAERGRVPQEPADQRRDGCPLAVVGVGALLQQAASRRPGRPRRPLP